MVSYTVSHPQIHTMPFHDISADVWLCIAGHCDGVASNCIAATCKRFRQAFRHYRHFVLVATPARIQLGMFQWLQRYIVANTNADVDGPPVGYLTIVLPKMPDYDDDLGDSDDVSVSDSDASDPENRPRPYAHEREFLSTVCMAVAAIPNIKLVVGHHSPMSLSRLADAMQKFARGGCLVLDLSHLVDYDLTAFHLGRSMWATLLRLDRLHVKLENTNADDRLVRGLVSAVEASLISKHPVAWRDLTLGLAHNLITDQGLTLMIHSLGRCPQLAQLTLDVSRNKQIQHPDDKVATIVDAVGHIPSLHIKLDGCDGTIIRGSHPRHPCLFLSFCLGQTQKEARCASTRYSKIRRVSGAPHHSPRGGTDPASNCRAQPQSELCATACG